MRAAAGRSGSLGGAHDFLRTFTAGLMRMALIRRDGDPSRDPNAGEQPDRTHDEGRDRQPGPSGAAA